MLIYLTDLDDRYGEATASPPRETIPSTDEMPPFEVEMDQFTCNL